MKRVRISTRGWVVLIILLVVCSSTVFVRLRRQEGAERTMPCMKEIGHVDGHERPCTPVKHLVFLKTRKTGGSAIQNILMRYGISRNLNFALPGNEAWDPSMFGYPYMFNRKYVANASTAPFDIICHHMVYDRSPMSELTYENSFRFSILRNPVEQLESIFWYAEINKRMGFKNSNAFLIFLTTPRYFFNKYKKQRYNLRDPNLFDFGFPMKHQDDKKMINFTISVIESHFHFIMIYEYFEESLVLLKHILCWSWDDIVTFHVNTPTAPHIRSNLTGNPDIIIREWLAGDILFYNTFLQKFHRLMDSYGRTKLTEDVHYLRQRTKEWYDVCIDRTVPYKDITDPELKPWDPHITGFLLRDSKLRNQTCRNLATPELPFTDKLKNLQARSKPKCQKIT